MDHNNIRHMLSEYIDGAVSPEDRAAIDEHLKTCEKCTEALRELRQTVAVIRSVEELDPPAWMKQKIMAKVRSKAEKKSRFQRFFFPLSVKIPLEAIGVLFIAVTAVFIYQNMQPSLKASRQQLAEQTQAPETPAVIAKNEEARSAEPLRSSKEPPQSPGYKALDMKQEYEKPAPPALQDRSAAPAPPPSAKQAEQPAPLVQAERKQFAYSAAESVNARSLVSKEKADDGTMRAQAAAPAEAASRATVRAKKASPSAAMAGAVAADKKGPSIVVQVADREAAAKKIEKEIALMNGAIVRRESPGEKLVLVVRIKTTRVGELKKKLKLLGEIKEQLDEQELQKEQVELRIELSLKAAVQ